MSVIIPAFNGAATLRMPIESITRQTYGDIELIIVDDGSTDDTRRVADDLLRDLPFPSRVVSHDGNRGLSVARNTGLSEARGEWIQFLDADDYIAPTKISTQIAVAAMADAFVASVYSPFQTFALDGDVRRTIDHFRFPDVEQALPIAFLLPRGFVHLSATLTRRSAMLDAGGFKQEAVPWEDDEIKVRMALAGYHFVRVSDPEPAFFWRLYPGQQRWGGPNARYRMERVANRFLSAVTLALGGVPPDAAALPLDLLGELDDQLTSQVRLMFRHDRQMGDAFLAKVLAYYPRFRPTGPGLSRRVSSMLGVQRFEHAVAKVRSLQRAIRAGGSG